MALLIQAGKELLLALSGGRLRCMAVGGPPFFLVCLSGSAIASGLINSASMPVPWARSQAAPEFHVVCRGVGCDASHDWAACEVLGTMVSDSVATDTMVSDAVVFVAMIFGSVVLSPMILGS